MTFNEQINVPFRWVNFRIFCQTFWNNCLNNASSGENRHSNLCLNTSSITLVYVYMSASLYSALTHNQQTKKGKFVVKMSRTTSKWMNEWHSLIDGKKDGKKHFRRSEYWKWVKSIEKRSNENEKFVFRSAVVTVFEKLSKSKKLSITTPCQQCIFSFCRRRFMWFKFPSFFLFSFPLSSSLCVLVNLWTNFLPSFFNQQNNNLMNFLWSRIREFCFLLFFFQLPVPGSPSSDCCHCCVRSFIWK